MIIYVYVSMMISANDYERNDVLLMTNKKPIHVYRGNFIESSHDLHIAVVHASGKLIATYGDPSRLTFARSSMKPLQVLPVVTSGAARTYAITDRELSLFCASHSGEPFHREAVAGVLEKLHLPEEKLQCGTHIPRDHESYIKLVKEGGELTPYYSNCSGKHAGMLTACTHQKMDIDTYREVNHPYQQQIIDAIAEVSSFDRTSIETSVDGCGVPVHRLPLYHIALSFARLAQPDSWKEGTDSMKHALESVRKAMTSYPEMVAGTDRFDTDLMEAFEGRIVAKGGAEGVHCFGDQETGIGVALKVEDGNGRATSVASMEVMRQLAIGTGDVWSNLENHVHVPVSNARKESIGVIKPSFTLQQILPVDLV